jgi:hypothetical protein
MDEKLKRMQIQSGWKIKTGKCFFEQNLFTTKNYVSIQTLFVHNWKVCVNWNTTCSSPRSMFPLGIDIVWHRTFSIPF